LGGRFFTFSEEKAAKIGGYQIITTFESNSKHTGIS
jgi:hypothetical protein